MLRNWKFWAVLAVVGIGLGVGAGWVTQRMWVNYHAERLLSDDPDVQLAETNYWLGKHGFEWAAKEPAICRAVLKRLPKASPSAIVDFYQSLDDFYESPILEMGIPYLIDAAIEGAKRRDGGGFVLASLQAISRLRPQDIDDATLAAWESASTYPEATVRRGAIGYGAGLAPEQAGVAIGWYLDDQDPENARRAWLLMAFLDPASGHAGNWRESPEGIGEAILYAAIATSDRPDIVLGQVDEDATLRERFEPIRRFLEIASARREAAGRQAFEGQGTGKTRPRWTRLSDRHQWFEMMLREAFEDQPEEYESLRVMIPDCPLPPGPLTDEERSFAEQVFEAWWSVNDRYYAFDENAKVFRRIDPNEKGPE